MKKSRLLAGLFILSMSICSLTACGSKETVQEAAEMLGVSASRVKKMVADKVIDGFKRDGRVWLSRVAVQRRADYIAEHGRPTRGKAKN